MRLRDMVLIGGGVVVVFFILLVCAALVMSIFQLGGNMPQSDLGGKYPIQGSESDKDNTGGYYPTGYPTPRPSVAPDAYSDVSNRKVIMTASVTIETGNFDQVVAQVRTLGTSAGGYVQSSSIDTYTNRRTGTVTLKVPQSAYENTISEIKKLGSVKSERSSGTDVTGTYVDLDARLKNAKATETRLTDILSRAGTTTDILAVEKELSRVRGDIESLTAQMNTLTNQIDFSTITVTINEPQPVVAYDWGIGNAFTDAVHMFVSMIGALIILTGFLIPLGIYLVLCAVVLYLCYKGIIRAQKWLGRTRTTAEEKK